MWWAKYIGIPFVELGRTKKGADCWGLLRLVYEEELGLVLPEFTAHAGNTDRAAIAAQSREAYSYFTKVEEPQPFAAAVFISAVTFAHVGILVDRGKMLHTEKGKDACIEPWSPKAPLLKGFYVPNDRDIRQA